MSFFHLFSSFCSHLSRLRFQTRLLLILLYLPRTPTTLERLNNRLISRKQVSYRVVLGRNDYKQALFWVDSGRNDQEQSRVSENREPTKVVSTISACMLWSLIRKIIMKFTYLSLKTLAGIQTRDTNHNLESMLANYPPCPKVPNNLKWLLF